jgi:hypothetical protein
MDNTNNTAAPVALETLRARARWIRIMRIDPSYCTTLDRDQITEDHATGENDYLRKTIMRERSPEMHLAAAAGVRIPTVVCSGWHRHFDTDYDCAGCYGCRAAARPAWVIGALIWSIATGGERDRLAAAASGMAGLARLGAAIAAALAPGLLAVGFVQLSAFYNRIQVGAWVRVAGGAGRAKLVRGREGEVVSVEESSFRGRTSTSVGIKLDGRTSYVGIGQVIRIYTPDAEIARKLAVASRPKFTGGKGSIGYVIAGPDAGMRGVVIWLGSQVGGGMRAGLVPDTTAAREARRRGVRSNDATWVDVADLADHPVLFAAGSEELFSIQVMVDAFAYFQASDAEVTEGYERAAFADAMAVAS